MELRSLVGAEPWAMKTFPFRSQGVLLPRHDRQAAALGICMYTACKPWVVTLQTAAHHLVRRAGTRWLAGRTAGFPLSPGAEEGTGPVGQGEGLVGRGGPLGRHRPRGARPTRPRGGAGGGGG